MLRHALKHAALAAALLIPTLVGVVATSPAYAAPGGSATAYPANDLPGQVMGETSLVETHAFDFDCGEGVSQLYHRYYTVAYDTGANPPPDAEVTRDGFPDYHFGPGSSITVNFITNSLDDNPCFNLEATEAQLTLRNMSGTAIGSTVTIGSVSDPLNGYTSNIYPVTLHFDSTGFGAGSGTAEVGEFYVGVKLIGNNEDGADTEGDAPSPTGVEHVDNSYTKGVFTTGYDLGISDERGATGVANDATAIGAAYADTRVFSPCWNLPGTSLNGYLSNGVTPVWSLKPLNFKSCGPNSTSSTVGNGFAYESIGGVMQSGWKTIADGAMDHNVVTVGGVGVDYGLVPILQALESLGKANNTVIGLAISHEAHDDSSDSGHTKCTGIGDTGCGGTSADFQAMYAHVHSLLGSNDVDYPFLRLFYIAVDSNMTQKTGSQAPSCTSTSPIGCADIMRPADTDYDLFGADVYNYYDFNGSSYHLATDTSKLGDATHSIIGLAELHQKHVVATELGTHPGCQNGGTQAVSPASHTAIGAGCTTGQSTDTKNQWFADLGSKMTSNSDYETWFEGFIYFNESPTDPQHKGTYDWEYVNKTNPDNNDLSCPTPSGTNNCWDGDSAGDGYETAFVTGTDHAWFLSGSRIDF